MRNRLARTVGATQVLKPDQHGEGAFDLAVEMHLLTAEPLQLVAIEGLAEALLAEQRPVGKLLLPGDVAGQGLAFKVPPHAFGVGRGRLLFLLQLVRIAGEHVLPRFPHLVRSVAGATS